jgi:hypothetical protein
MEMHTLARCSFPLRAYSFFSSPRNNREKLLTFCYAIESHARASMCQELFSDMLTFHCWLTVIYTDLVNV